MRSWLLCVVLTAPLCAFILAANETELNEPSEIIFNAEEALRLRIFLNTNDFDTLTLKTSSVKHLTLNDHCKQDSRVVLITHGFFERWRMKTRWDWVDDMKNEFLQSKDAKKLCVIAVDWEELAAGGLVPNYWKAISNMKIAGNLISSVLNNSRINVKNVYCIGFSLGAHMCSALYQVYYQRFGVKPGRITGLDPAGPFFKDKPDLERLSQADADFVDIIHTTEDFGVYKDTAHMDFYTNVGASKEDTCKDIRMRKEDTNVILYEDEASDPKTQYDEYIVDENSSRNMSKRSIADYLKSVLNKVRKLPKRVFINTHQLFGCGHLMAVRLFIYSINYCQFKSQVCEAPKAACKPTKDTEYPRMGYEADKSAHKYKTSGATFYVETTFKVPFCRDIHSHMLHKIKSYHEKMASKAANTYQTCFIQFFFLLIIFKFTFVYEL